VRTEAPLSTIPLYVRAGSIVPMGAAAECTEQLHRDTLEIRIYRGADGTFELYEDEGNNYNYEQGRYAIIPFHWNESGKTLTIESRKGAFDGMLKERYFHIVGVGTSEGKGMETAKGGQIIKYTGEKNCYITR
jgi:alpha-D-xyloside xylohydrolase